MIENKRLGGQPFKLSSQPHTILGEYELLQFNAPTGGLDIRIIRGEEYTANQIQKESVVYLLDEADSNISDINCKAKALIVSRKIIDSIRGDEW